MKGALLGLFLFVFYIGLWSVEGQTSVEPKPTSTSLSPTEPGGLKQATITLTPSSLAPTEPAPTTPSAVVVTSSAPNVTTQRPSPTTQVVPTTTVSRSPCKCREGYCLCCTGYILNRFNFTTQNRACLKVEYEPDEFEFNIKLLFNNRMLYQRKISGKNPQPICLPIRRIISINACIKFSNVYMIGRNLHACLDFKGDWNDEIELFSVSFECFRVGADGVALVKPEEGGGLPVPVHGPSSPPGDYDDSARAVALLDYEDDEEDESRPGFVRDD